MIIIRQLVRNVLECTYLVHIPIIDSNYMIYE